MQSSQIKQYDDRNLNASLLLTNSLKEIGFVLRQAREKRKLSIKDIRDCTSIPTHHIVALECGNRNSLPDDFSLVNFIKRYARIVGLNENILSDIYLKPRKEEKLNYEQDAFDILFTNEKTQNHSDRLEKFYFKGYHLYFCIGVTLFLLVSIIFFKVSENKQDNIPLAAEYNAGPDVNFANVESWVEGNSLTSDKKEQRIENKAETREQKPKSKSLQPKTTKTVVTRPHISTVSKKTNNVKPLQKKPITKIAHVSKPKVEKILKPITAPKPISIRAKEEINEMKLRPLIPVEQIHNYSGPSVTRE